MSNASESIAASTTIGAALAAALAQGVARIDAQMLLLQALGRDVHDRAWLIAHDRDALAPAAQEHFQHLLEQRRAGVPVAYLVGQREFHGLTLQVDARVLDPRPETETLVDWALALLPEDTPRRVLDLGTGSGAIALALAHRRPRISVCATDASAPALAVARANAERLGLQIAFAPGEWYGAIGNARFDLIVSNPPYVAAGDPHLAALAHEPWEALASGADGLDALRTLCAGAPTHLQPGGWLLLEHGHDQAPAVRALLHRAGFTDVETRRDLAGIGRCSGGRYRGG